jgi:hypothetical protein
VKAPVRSCEDCPGRCRCGRQERDLTGADVAAWLATDEAARVLDGIDREPLRAAEKGQRRAA